MAHYDCSDCGADGGIGYGYCKSCTPTEVLIAEAKYEAARQRAEFIWNDVNYHAKKTFIELYTMSEREEYERLYEAGRTLNR